MPPWVLPHGGLGYCLLVDSTIDGGFEDVNGGLGDGALSDVIDSEWNREGMATLTGGILHMEEPWVVADVAEEELMFEAQVGVGKHAALWLKDGVDMFAGYDDVESKEEIVVYKSNDML